MSKADNIGSIKKAIVTLISVHSNSFKTIIIHINYAMHNILLATTTNNPLAEYP